jgi:four helix bundle protein
MTFDEWLKTVPAELSEDALWRMKVYRLAVFAGDLAWVDVTKLATDQRTRSLADQLYRAIGLIGANVAEGYGRSSGKDEVRFWEYALGSEREARKWYYAGRHILSPDVAVHRMKVLTEIIRLLLAMIPAQGHRRLAEDSAPYSAETSDLFDHLPMP